MGKAAIPCPASCGRFHEPGKFLCARCWHALPAGDQHAVIRTWKAVERINPKAFPRDYLAALRTYREVREAALLHLANVRA